MFDYLHFQPPLCCKNAVRSHLNRPSEPECPLPVVQFYHSIYPAPAHSCDQSPVSLFPKQPYDKHIVFHHSECKDQTSKSKPQGSEASLITSNRQGNERRDYFQNNALLE